MEELPPESQLPDEFTSTVDETNPDQLIGESSAHPPGRQSFLVDSVSAVASPADIIPLPKITIKRKRSGKSLKSVLLTSTPNKEHLEELEKEKLEREKNKLLRKSEKTKKALFSSDKPKLQRAKKKHHHHYIPPLIVIPILFTVQARM